MAQENIPIKFNMPWLNIYYVYDPRMNVLSEVTQSLLTLCNPVDCSLPGSSVHGILQARILEWVAISFSNAWKWKVKGKSLSRVLLCDPVDCSPTGSSVHGILQARILEWVEISFSRGSSWARDRTRVSRVAGRRFTVWAADECSNGC